MYKRDAQFAFEILKKHKLVYLQDESVYIEYKKQSQLYYLDMQSLFCQNSSSLKKRIKENLSGERNYV